MTDNEIIKVLECCNQNDCDNCSHSKVKPHNQNCNKFICENALDLINRQKAEIERLKRYDEERDIALHARLIANAKTEAIREFAEKTKKELSAFVVNVPEMCCVIDNLVKEMAEGGNG